MLVPFEIPPGLFSDDTTYSQPGAWETGSNVRFRFGKPQVIGGWVDALASQTVEGVCRNAFSWITSGGLSSTAYGTHSHLEIVRDGIIYDITPSGLVAGAIDSTGGSAGWGTGAWDEGTWGSPATVYYARTWSFSSYGDFLIANPRGGGIYEWDNDTSNLATAVTNAPDEVTACLVTPERQILAFGCNEELSGDFNHMCIRGSNIEDITDWTTSPTNNAFEIILEGVGRIVTARIIGSYIAVWTTEGLYLGQFLGNPGQAYRFDRIAEHCGIVGANAIAVIDQTAIWLGSDYQFRIWTLGDVPKILTCPIWKDFRDHLVTEQTDKVVGTTIASYGEAWFFYPDSRDGLESSRYVAFSFRESGDRPVWFTGELARTQAMDASVNSYPLMTEYSGRSYFHEYGTQADGEGLSWNIQSSDTYLEEGNRELMVRRLIPDFEDQDGDVSLTLTMRRYPMGAGSEKGPFVITVGDMKKDFRASGRLISTRWEGTGYMRLGRPVFDVQPMGER